MISRASAKKIAEVYAKFFFLEKEFYAGITALYDYFFERNYDREFLRLYKVRRLDFERHVIEFIMGIHTGESVASPTGRVLSLRERKKLGQQYLLKMAEDIIRDYEESGKGDHEDEIKELKARLELDGYVWSPDSKKLLYSEAAVLDVKEEQGILMSLAKELGLNNQDVISHHLRLSEEHYIVARWDDSISNSRKVLEAILQGVASKISIAVDGKTLAKNIIDSGWKLREYLKEKDIIGEKEKEAISSTYGLLSDTGGHPYIAQKDEARLMRHLALTYGQFMMLRLKGFLAPAPS